jgi:hypothetical protein
VTPLYRDRNGNLTLTLPGELPPEYAGAMQGHGAADPLVSLCMDLLDKYVAAYDQRQRCRGSSIAEDATTDEAYNGLLRREEERAGAFIARVCNAQDAARPGLGGGESLRPRARQWLALVAEATDAERPKRRAEVLRELRNVSPQEP